MASIGRIILVSLLADPPSSLNLPQLRTLDESCRTIVQSLEPFSAADAEPPLLVNDLAAIASVESRSDLTVVYVVGHAWVEEQGFTLAMRDSARAGNDNGIRGHELIARLAPLLDCGGVVLLVDTCHAAAMEHDLVIRPPAVAIFASAADEPALEFPIDRATRFSLTVAQEMQRPKEIDAVELALSIRKRLLKASVIEPQSVTYWSAGPRIVLTRRGVSSHARGGRTTLILRWTLVGMGAIVIGGIIWLSSWYFRHVWITVRIGALASIGSDIAVEIWTEDPDQNRSILVSRHVIGSGGVFRSRVLAGNLVVAVTARYSDGAPRSIRFPLVRRPSWEYSTKKVVLRVPDAVDVLRHRSMAWISGSEWLEGVENRSSTLERSFWIDLLPVTVKEYLPIAQRLIAEGKLDADSSVLVHEIQIEGATGATGLNQLDDLVSGLRDIFDVVERGEPSSPPLDLVSLFPNVKSACPDCPAPMTLQEARLYCEARGMRLPEGSAWEIAARGADGRRFPWGNVWDSTRGNAGLPQAIGKPQSLVPSSARQNDESPFGVRDMVGNAGDWVEPAGSYDRVFMGGSYRMNPEDCEVFDVTPDTSEMLPLFQVTARCADVR
jgi:hypothetical protein